MSKIKFNSLAEMAEHTAAAQEDFSKALNENDGRGRDHGKRWSPGDDFTGEDGENDSTAPKKAKKRHSTKKK